mmetsp:Transcript_13863/g.28010  ORF Transcript_13863/g.28010 Transcript_13863/m.28010 type:complete len:230 (+) Transcript_13863:308-997(+)
MEAVLKAEADGSVCHEDPVPSVSILKASRAVVEEHHAVERRAVVLRDPAHVHRLAQLHRNLAMQLRVEANHDLEVGQRLGAPAPDEGARQVRSQHVGLAALPRQVVLGRVAHRRDRKPESWNSVQDLDSLHEVWAGLANVGVDLCERQALPAVPRAHGQVHVEDHDADPAGQEPSNEALAAGRRVLRHPSDRSCELNGGGRRQRILLMVFVRQAGSAGPRCKKCTPSRC